MRCRSTLALLHQFGAVVAVWVAVAHRRDMSAGAGARAGAGGVMQISKIGTAADEIARARLSGTPLAPLHPFLRPADEAAAYAVQAALHERLEPTFGRRVGYKIGCTTPVMQAYLGIHSPCSAGIFANGVHTSGVALRHDDYRRIGVECEIAVRLGRDLPGRGAPFSAEGVRDAVADYMAAIEIVDDRYADWRKTDTPTLIADDFFAAGCVLGRSRSPIPATRPDSSAPPTINGVEVGRGEGRDVMGHPLNALAWLATSLAVRGRPLRAGEIVLLGSLVETKWLARGDTCGSTIAELGRSTLAGRLRPPADARGRLRSARPDGRRRRANRLALDETRPPWIAVRARGSRPGRRVMTSRRNGSGRRCRATASRSARRSARRRHRCRPSRPSARSAGSSQAIGDRANRGSAWRRRASAELVLGARQRCRRGVPASAQGGRPIGRGARRATSERRALRLGINLGDFAKLIKRGMTHQDCSLNAPPNPGLARR